MFGAQTEMPYWRGMIYMDVNAA